MDLLHYPAMSEDDPLDIVAEGSEAQPGHWPEIKMPTNESKMCAEDGNGHPMRQHFLAQGYARFTDDVSLEFQKMLGSEDGDEGN